MENTGKYDFYLNESTWSQGLSGVDEPCRIDSVEEVIVNSLITFLL